MTATSGGTSGSSTVKVTDIAPQVMGVYVSGSAWSTANPSTDLYGALAAAGAGSATLGYELASGAGQLSNASIPGWVNLNTISFVFSKPVSGVTALSLFLGDSSNHGGPSSGITVASETNPSTTVATFTLSGPLTSNKYYLDLAAAGITDAAGTPLDGAWTTGVSTFAAGSGDGSPGSDFVYRFNVLAGDVNGDGKVSAADVAVMGNQPPSLTDNASNWRYDINGAGKVGAADVALIGSQPPAVIAVLPEPILPGSSGGAMLPAVASNSSNRIAITAGTPMANDPPAVPAGVASNRRAPVVFGAGRRVAGGRAGWRGLAWWVVENEHRKKGGRFQPWMPCLPNTAHEATLTFRVTALRTIKKSNFLSVIQVSPSATGAAGRNSEGAIR